MTLRLELVGISKQYPAVKANDDVSLRVQPGEIHAVLGENGAGKSTLMKIIYGAVRPDAGEMRWNGQAVQVASPAAARALGISMVYQHFSLFDTLTAAENVWLGLDKAGSLADVTRRIRDVGRGRECDGQRGGSQGQVGGHADTVCHVPEPGKGPSSICGRPRHRQGFPQHPE